MILLDNGASFNYVVASGAWGFDGKDAGHGLVKLWKYPFRKLGALNLPRSTLLITKSFTNQPLKGNLKVWCPWRCVRPVKNGWVNAVGLTNPGIDKGLALYAKTLSHYPGPVAISIAPANKYEAANMVSKIAKLPKDTIQAIEVNTSCPNVKHKFDSRAVVEILKIIKDNSGHPLILKLGPQDPIGELLVSCDKLVQVFDLINTVPWVQMYPNKLSPLSNWNLSGGLSGPIIKYHAREILKQARLSKHIQIISGGGIGSLAEAELRFALGANAISFGSIFLNKPWLPKQIIKKLEGNRSK